MAYANYEYYTSEYKGFVLPSDKADYYLTRASDKVDYYSSYNIAEATEQIQKCTCAVADKLYKQDTSDNLASEGSGNYTRTYREPKEDSVYDIISEYLSKTGLLYRGV